MLCVLHVFHFSWFCALNLVFGVAFQRALCPPIPPLPVNAAALVDATIWHATLCGTWHDKLQPCPGCRIPKYLQNVAQFQSARVAHTKGKQGGRVRLLPRDTWAICVHNLWGGKRQPGSVCVCVSVLCLPCCAGCCAVFYAIFFRCQSDLREFFKPLSDHVEELPIRGHEASGLCTTGITVAL